MRLPCCLFVLFFKIRKIGKKYPLVWCPFHTLVPALMIIQTAALQSLGPSLFLALMNFDRPAVRLIDGLSFLCSVRSSFINLSLKHRHYVRIVALVCLARETSVSLISAKNSSWFYGLEAL